MDKPDIFSTNIVGPIHSRRLGISLGVNLLPKDGKVCSFDCLYCEVGWNADHRGGKFPEADAVMAELEAKLQAMHSAGEALDVITFAGNGSRRFIPTSTGSSTARLPCATSTIRPSRSAS